jgi:hypothetical protein
MDADDWDLFRKLMDYRGFCAATCGLHDLSTPPIFHSSFFWGIYRIEKKKLRIVELWTRSTQRAADKRYKYTYTFSTSIAI